MAKFSVDVQYTCKYKKTLVIYALDSGEAEIKAASLVESWNNVDEVEVMDVEEQ